MIAVRYTKGSLMALSLLAVAAPAAAQDEGDAASGNSRRVEFAPYIEASQVITAELSPGDDVVTYTRVAAGVDANFGTRNSEGAISLRYERQFGWGDAGDVDTISGIARTSLAVVPRLLTVEAGALASRSRFEGNGATSSGGFGDDPSSTGQIYSLYAGPSVSTEVGQVQVSGAYLLGYTRVEAPESVVVSPGADPVDIFDDSIVQQATVRVGIAPGDVLPVGLGVGAGWNRQDVSNLDQRIDDRHVRADVTVPVSRELALVGGVGYEEVEVSSRDAIRDPNGNPMIGRDGRLVTDESGPRQIAYETDGLIWDAGVMWRPSRRTSLSASVGKRYGSTIYYGAFSYAPSPRTAINISVYDGLTSFGGLTTSSLDALGTDFEAFRNPITGDLSGCVGSAAGGNCTLAGLGSIRSAVFRSRGVSATVSRSLGRSSYGLGMGYDRRKYIAAAGTALASVNGLEDENYWVSFYASRQLDRQSSLGFNASGVWFESGAVSAGEALGYSASLSYDRNFFAGLSGTAAVGIDGVERDESLLDYSAASALLGLRYTF
jgi:hypothetical protein